MRTQEKKFVDELEVFRKEAQAGTQFFYAYLGIKAIIGDNKKALDAVNVTPLFWATNIGALQTAFFIALGRVFDQRSEHNIHNLLRIAQAHMDIFSKYALAERRRRDSQNADQWLDDFLRRAHEVTAEDFRRLRKHVKKYQQIYAKNYRDIRHKIYAHKELSEKTDEEELYKKTQIRELERLFVFLNQLHEALWELFINGRKPVLRPMRYSVKSIRANRNPVWKGRAVQELIVNQAQDFFNLLLCQDQQDTPTNA